MIQIQEKNSILINSQSWQRKITKETQTNKPRATFFSWPQCLQFSCSWHYVFVSFVFSALHACCHQDAPIMCLPLDMQHLTPPHASPSAEASSHDTKKRNTKNKKENQVRKPKLLAFYFIAQVYWCNVKNLTNYHAHRKDCLSLSPARKSSRFDFSSRSRSVAWSRWSRCRRWNLSSLSSAKVPAKRDPPNSSSI